MEANVAMQRFPNTLIVACMLATAAPVLAQDIDEPGIASLRAPAETTRTSTQQTVTRAPRAKRISSQPPADATRILYGSTALAAEKGTLNWTMYNLGLHQFDVQATDNLNFGVTTIVPIGVVAFIGHGTATFEVSPNVHLGVKVQGGVAHAFFSGTGGTVGMWGGGAMATFGSEDLFLNVGFSAYGVSGGGETLPLMLPTIGGSWRVHRRVRLNLEAYAPLSPDLDDTNGKLWVIMYGARFTGDNIYGDVGFVIPAFPGAEEFLKYMPLGMPMLALGYSW